MILEFIPPVATVFLGVKLPVCGSTVNVDRLLEDEFATIANRCAGGGGGGGVLTAPQPLRSTGTMRATTKRTVSLAGMPVLLISFSGPRRIAIFRRRRKLTPFLLRQSLRLRV